VSDVITTEPAAGWYQDPSDPASMRWWSGEGWTDHVRPLVTPAAAPAVAVPAGVSMDALASVQTLAPVQTAMSFAPGGPAPVADGASSRWTSNYTEDELTLYTSRGASAKPVVEGPRATTIMADGRTYISFDRDGDGIPDPPPPAGRAWAAALMPAVSFVLLLALFGMHSIGAVPPLAVLLALVPLPFGLLFEILDGAQLRSRGYPAPGLGWHLLGTCWYLVRRITRLNAGPGRGVGPLVAYLVSTVLLGAALAFLSPSLGLAAVGAAPAAPGADPFAAAAQHAVEDTIETQSAAKGVTLTADCSDADVQVAPGSTFDCTGTGADGTRYRIAVEIHDGGTATFAVTPVS
jgi:hypothetical protein